MSVVRAVGAFALVVFTDAACASFGSNDADTADTADSGTAQANAIDAGADAPIDRATAYAEAVKDDNPLGYWRLHDVENAAYAASEVLPATMAGTFPATKPQPGVAGIFGPAGAFHFDGSPGMLIQVANVAFQGDTGVTVEAWFRPTAGSDGSFRHIFEQSTGANGSAYGVWIANGVIAGEHYAATYNQQNQLPEPKLNAWHYVAMTIAPGTTGAITVYLDDANPQTTTTVKIQNPIGTEPFTIGCKTRGDNAINGDLTEVAVYAYALTAERIRAHYDLGKPPSP